MTPLEKYLNTATRGLWGKKKLEVREELEAHVLEKAKRHQLLGLTEHAAISRTLEELGHSQTINRKMTEVYTMPTIRSGLLIGALFTAAFSLTATGVAQVAISEIGRAHV